MLISIRHVTRYTYAQPVGYAISCYIFFEYRPNLGEIEPDAF